MSSAITPAREPENLQRLAAALRALDARVFTESVPEGLSFDCSADMLARADAWHLVTTLGRVNVIVLPPGTTGYEELAASSVTYDLPDASVAAASLSALLRMKEAAGRPKDLQAADVIRAMLARDAERGR